MAETVKISVSPGACILMAAGFLLLPLPWIAALCVSSLVHELCHYAALRVNGIRIMGLRIESGGLYLETAPLPPMQILLCALAGPVGALSLLLLVRWFPRTGLCAVIQSLYHLLPVYPLDGGRAVRALTEYCGWSRSVCDVLEILALAVIAWSGLYFMRAAGFGWLPGVAAFAVIFRSFREKYLAKKR